jgi:hypothetical protein
LNDIDYEVLAERGWTPVVDDRGRDPLHLAKGAWHVYDTGDGDHRWNAERRSPWGGGLQLAVRVSLEEAVAAAEADRRKEGHQVDMVTSFVARGRWERSTGHAVRVPGDRPSALRGPRYKAVCGVDVGRIGSTAEWRPDMVTCRRCRKIVGIGEEER